jgi:hypothetical protein
MPRFYCNLCAAQKLRPQSARDQKAATAGKNAAKACAAASLGRQPRVIAKHLPEKFAAGELLISSRVGVSLNSCRTSEAAMNHKETFWMACDSTEQLRAEYGPFHTRAEAEAEARKLGFGYLLRYEHLIDEHDEIQEVRCIFIELQAAVGVPRASRKLHTRCATCGEMSIHEESWQAEVWADIHEFEHARHRVRLFEQTRAEGLKEICDWRDQCA